MRYHSDNAYDKLIEKIEEMGLEIYKIEFFGIDIIAFKNHEHTQTSTKELIGFEIKTQLTGPELFRAIGQCLRYMCKRFYVNNPCDVDKPDYISKMYLVTPKGMVAHSIELFDMIVSKFKLPLELLEVDFK